MIGRSWLSLEGATLLSTSVAMACGGGQLASNNTTSNDLTAIDGTHWTWASATCDDGAHQLDARGFEDHLSVGAIGSGLRLNHDYAFVTEGCAETVVTWASANGSAFRFADQARVADSVEHGCVATWPREQGGEIHLRDGTLDVRTYRSNLCGGYDIVHHYRRVPNHRGDERALIRHFVAGLILRDPDVIARDVAQQASLVVPAVAKEGGGQKRYEGRAAVAAWFTAMVRSVAWFGARVVDVSELRAGHYLARLEYMDSALATPLLIELTLTLADHEIYEAQWALASPIAPRETPQAEDQADTVVDAGSPLPDTSWLPDTAAP